MNNTLKEKIMKTTLQIMILILMISSLAIKHIIIDWFNLPFIINFPMNWAMFFMLGILFLTVTFYE